jgi:4-carboxymuconolactone decarboxylase
VAREWTNEFEWAVHAPLAEKAGVSLRTLESIGAGRRPDAMADDEALVHDFARELLERKGVCDATYEGAVKLLGERALLDLIGLIGYFAGICMVMNVAHAPAPSGSSPLITFPP